MVSDQTTLRNGVYKARPCQEKRHVEIPVLRGNLEGPQTQVIG